MKKTLLGSLCAVVLLAGLMVVGSPLAQEKPGEAEPPARPRAQARGRLPNYYRQVVTPDQREKIYAVQAKYVEQIEALEKQILDLEAKRDTEVEALLSPEQKEKVKALREEARKRREAAAAERTEPETTEAAPSDK
jgi:Spy/CpxP family protein refolding chaperone